MEFLAFLRILSYMLEKKRKRLLIDGTILNVANVHRAMTHKIKRFSGKKFWAKRKRREDVNFLNCSSPIGRGKIKV